MKQYLQQAVRVTVALGLTLTTLAVSAPKAEAAFIAALCDDAACSGAGDTFITDGGAGDMGALAGSIVYIGAFNGFSFVLDTSLTKPVFGTAAAPSINIAYQLIGAGSVYLYAGDTDYTGVGAATMNVNSSTSGQFTTGFVLGGGANTNLLLSPVVLQTGPTADVFTTSVSGGSFGPGPYALSAGVLVNRATAGTTSGDITVTVPEPASMVLLGLGLLGAGLARRRKQ